MREKASDKPPVSVTVDPTEQSLRPHHDWSRTELFAHCKTLRRFHKPILNDPTEKKIISILTNLRLNPHSHE